MEVILMLKNKRVSVRLSDKEEQIIVQLKKAFSEQHHVELSDSDIVRQALAFMYNSSTGGKEK